MSYGTMPVAVSISSTHVLVLAHIQSLHVYGCYAVLSTTDSIKHSNLRVGKLHLTSQQQLWHQAQV